jgi:hypothetical protein
MLVLDDSLLRSKIVDHLEHAAEAARTAASHPDLAIGVMEARKAARRVRAVVDLVREAISRRERRSVREAIRHARRVLGPARDHAVAAHIIPTLVLDEPAREAARIVLHAAGRDLPSAEETRQALAECADTVAAQVEALRSALPDVLALSSIIAGVQSLYGRTRHARKAAKRSKRAFHAWRRRTKELAYQLDVLGDIAGERLVELRSAIRDVSVGQRDVVDLMLLRTFTRSYRDVVHRDAIELLVEAIDAQLLPLQHDVRRAAKPAFARKPRSLSRIAPSA